MSAFKYTDDYKQSLSFDMSVQETNDGEPYIEFTIAFDHCFATSNYLFDFNDVKRLCDWLDKMINSKPIEYGESMIDGRYQIEFMDFHTVGLGIKFQAIFGRSFDDNYKYVFGGVNIHVFYDTTLVNDDGCIHEGPKGTNFVDLGFDYSLTKLRTIMFRDYLKEIYNKHI